MVDPTAILSASRLQTVKVSPRSPSPPNTLRSHHFSMSMVSNLGLLSPISVISQSSRQRRSFRKRPCLYSSETRLKSPQVYDYLVTMDMEVRFTPLYCLTTLKFPLISGPVCLEVTGPYRRSIILYCAILALFRSVDGLILSVLASGPLSSLIFIQTLLGLMFLTG